MARNAVLWTVTLVLITTGAASCGSDTDAGSDGAAPPASSTPTTEAPDAVGGLDFGKGSEVQLGDGWIVSPCESGPPLFCARHDGETQAVVELLSVPAASYPAIKKVFDAGGTAEEALRAHVADFHATFQEDRPVGCGTDYGVKPFGPDTALVAGAKGTVFGFDGVAAGRHVERALQFATIKGSMLHIITTNGIVDDTCMDDGELSEFTIDELKTLEPKITQMIAASTLP